MPAVHVPDLFVAARYSYGPGLIPRGLLIHMAEGGGTVGYLSRNPARGVSVHYVIEYTGRIVQMLDHDICSGSVNPRDIRGLIRLVKADDAPFVGYDGERITFGATAAKAVLGNDGWRNPNRYTISVEVEGFARDHWNTAHSELIPGGPNEAQRNALRRLYLHLRATVPTLRGALGHRDFAAYKACPGRNVNWASMGGHGRWKE